MTIKFWTKRVIDTEMKDYHLFNFTEELYRKVKTFKFWPWSTEGRKLKLVLYALGPYAEIHWLIKKNRHHFM
jgi:hypothetical protein